MAEAVIEMTRKSFGIAGVVRDDALIGVITDGDLRRHSDRLFDQRAEDVMTTNPKVVSEGALCEDTLAVLQEHRITALFVTAHDAPERPVGLVHIHDLARSSDG
jgi:arabinose-5-phosphate isomerase